MIRAKEIALHGMRTRTYKLESTEFGLERSPFLPAYEEKAANQTATAQLPSSFQSPTQWRPSQVGTPFPAYGTGPACAQQEKIEVFPCSKFFPAVSPPEVCHRKHATSSLATILLAERRDEVSQSDRTIR